MEIAAGASYGGSQWANGYHLVELDPGRGEARVHLRAWKSPGLWEFERRDRYPAGVFPTRFRHSPRVPKPALLATTATGTSAVVVASPPTALREVAGRLLQRDLDEALALLSAHQFAQALERFTALQHALRASGTAADVDSSLRRAVHVAALNSAVCLLNLQRPEEAASVLLPLEVGQLNQEHRVFLARLWVLLDEPARAAAALPDEPDSDGAAVVQAMIEIARGGPPPDPVPADLDLRVFLARVHLARGALAEASDIALPLCEPAVERWARLAASGVLYEALARTVIRRDEPTTGGVPMAARSTVLFAMEIVIREALKDPVLANQARRLGLVFYTILMEEAGRAEVLTSELGEDLADAGTLVEVPILPDPEWTERLRDAVERLDPDAQIAILTDARAKWPARYLIARALARALTLLHRWRDALPHARAAFEMLPSRQNRLALCVLCYNLGERQELVQLLKDEAGWGDVLEPSSPERTLGAQVLLLKALTSEEPTQALRLLSAVDRDVPLDAQMLAWRANLLDRLGRAQDAAEVARSALDLCLADWAGGRPGLGHAALHRVAMLALAPGQPTQRDRERIGAVIRGLKARDHDTASIGLRFSLALRAGVSPELEVDEQQKLVEGKIVQPKSLEQLLEMRREDFARFDKLYTSYRNGLFLFAQTARGMETGLLRFTVALTEVPEEVPEPPFLSPVLSVPREAADLRGRWLVTGLVELVLLAQAGLLEALNCALGDGGGVVLFQDDWERAREETHWWPGSPMLRDLDEARQLEGAMGRLADDLEILRAPSSGPIPSAAFQAEERGVLLVDDGEDDNDGRALPPGELAVLLHRLDPLPRELRERAVDPTTRPRIEELPKVIAVSYSGLWWLHKMGILEPLTRHTMVVVPAWTAHLLRSRIRELEQVERAAKLSLSLWSWLGSLEPDRLQRIPREEPSDKLVLPQLEGHDVHDIVWEWFSPFAALADREDRLVLSMEALVGSLSEGRGNAVLSRLPWTASLQRPFDGLIECARGRVLDPPRLLLSLGLGPEELRRQQRHFLALGFFDRGSGVPLAAIIKDRGSLLRGEVARLLSRLEGRARWTESHEDVLYRKDLGLYYGDLFWSLFEDDEISDETMLVLSGELLERLGVLEQGQIGTVYGCMWEIATRVFTFPFAAVTQDGAPSKRWVAQRDRLLRLLAQLRVWSEQGRLRSGPLETGLRYALARLPVSPIAELPGYKDRLAPFIDELMPRRKAGQTGLMCFDDPLAEIWSSLGASDDAIFEPRVQLHSPHGDRDLGLEDVLRKVAEGLRRDDGISRYRMATDGRLFYADLDVGWPAPIRVAVPIEGVITRLHHKARRKRADQLACLHGVLDGRLADALLTLARPGAGGRSAALELYGVLSLIAPYRAIRDNPALIGMLDLPVSSPDLAVGNLDVLRAILCEAPFGPSATLEEALSARLAPEGTWRGLPWRPELLELLLEVPFVNPVGQAVASIQAADPAAAGIGDAIRRLSSHPHYSAGRIATDLMMVVAFAALHPDARPAGQVLPLREQAPDLVLEILRALDGVVEVRAAAPGQLPQVDGPAVSLLLADAEPAVLRSCARVVLRLAMRGREPISSDEHLWLTWRLYGWFIRAAGRDVEWAQLQALAPAASPRDQWEASPLDPSRYGPGRLNHRLMAALSALVHLGHVAAVLPEALLTHEQKRRLSALPLASEPLLAWLAEVASRPATDEELDLKKALHGKRLANLGIGAVPELALVLLCMIDPAACLRIEREACLRHLGAPASTDDGSVGRWSLATALASHYDDLDAPLQAQLRELALAERDAGTSHPSDLLLVALASSGADDLRAQAEARLLQVQAEPSSDNLQLLWIGHLVRRGERDTSLWLDRLRAEPDALPSLRLARILVRAIGAPGAGTRAVRAAVAALLNEPGVRDDPDVGRCVANLDLESASEAIAPE